MASNNPAPDILTVDYGSKDEKADSDYQLHWADIMDKGPYRTPLSYEKVEVMLLRWQDNCDDLDTKGEVADLSNVFKKSFGFNVTIECLDDESTLPMRINAIISQWIYKHHAPNRNTLLIVYYAGHGKPGLIPGEMSLYGHASPNETKKQINNFIWNNVELLLRDAKADVLEIFDCCHAGNLTLSRGPPRAFEFLAATGAMGSTPVPGEDSFTRALIFALETLVLEKPNGRFTTLDLVSTITERAPHFSNKKDPKLTQRFNHSGRIMLHPLHTSKLREQAPAPNEDLLDHMKRHTLTLHFDLSTSMDFRDLEIFGGELNKVFAYNNLGVNNIRWGGMEPVMFAQVANTFKTVIFKRRKRLSALNVEDLEQPSARTEVKTPSSTDNHSQLTYDSVMKSPLTQPTEISRYSSSPNAETSNEEEEGPTFERQKRKNKIREEDPVLLTEVGSCHEQTEILRSPPARKKKREN